MGVVSYHMTDQIASVPCGSGDSSVLSPTHSTDGVHRKKTSTVRYCVSVLDRVILVVQRTPTQDMH